MIYHTDFELSLSITLKMYDLAVLGFGKLEIFYISGKSHELFKNYVTSIDSQHPSRLSYPKCCQAINSLKKFLLLDKFTSWWGGSSQWG